MQAKTYITTSGDMWDSIAKNELGNELHKTALIKLNPEYASTYIFVGGVKLRVPEVEELETPIRLPPWKVARL